MYTTETKIENYSLTTIDNTFSDQITDWIEAVQKWIDNYTGRTFEATTALKKFDGTGKSELLVDDLLSVTNIYLVSNDSTADAGTQKLSTGDYYLYQGTDANKTPKDKIVINPYGSFRIFDKGLQNIWVEGSWGYSSSVPADIELASTKLVCGIINIGKNEGVSQFSQGDYSVTYRSFENIINSDVSVKQVLDWYKKSPRLSGFKTQRV